MDENDKYLNSRLDRLEGKMESKFDRIVDRLDSIDENLSEHMRRTELAEAATKLQKEHLDLVVKDVQPLKTHVAMWGGAGKVLAIGGIVIAILAGLAKLISFLKGGGL